MIIDAHTHLLDRGFWPDEWFDHVASEWAARRPDRRPEDVRERIEDGLADPDAERMITAMDRAGVDRAILLPMDWGPRFTTARPLEDYQAQTLRAARRYPDRFIPFAGVDPRRPDALERVSALVDAEEVVGLKLYPSAGWDPTHPAARELYDLMARKGMPVLFHTGDPLPILDSALGDPLLLDPVADTFGDLTIIAGHAGATSRWDRAVELARRHSNVLLETSVWVWADTPLERAMEVMRAMTHARETLGGNRFVFGTDHVSGRKVRGEEAMKTILDLYRAANDALGPDGFDAAEMAAFLGGTVAAVIDGAASPKAAPAL